MKEEVIALFYPMFFWDATYIFVIIGAVLSLIAQANVSRTFNKYSQIATRSGITGRDAAQLMLNRNSIHSVQIEPVRGNLTDHYNPREMKLALSEPVYGSKSIAAVGVAAHECGHAIQHDQQYGPLMLRSALVPVTNIGSTLSIPILIIGMLLNSSTGDLFIQIGLIAFSLTTVFTLITLPVEFNASKRALAILDQNNVLTAEELAGTKKVLNAAAMTYVAAAAASILQLLRLLLIARGRRR